MSADAAPRVPSPRKRVAKRAMDIALSSLALVLLLPVFGAIAVAIKLDSAGPVLFRQKRVGRGGTLFAIRKFRTMVVQAPVLGGSLTLRNDPRVTRVGAFLRRHKLDELPQLLDVLLGTMSLVGPRPEVPELMACYAPADAALICSVPPGMTDYASILFRNESDLLEASDDPRVYYRTVIMPLKLRHYERYIRDIGVLTDLRIMLATVALLVLGSIPRALGRGLADEALPPAAGPEHAPSLPTTA
jgi:lipopolysaccharide/colanic/teichoic acid biosynthesis glycosyltransferase